MVGVVTKAMFFDQKAVTRATDRATRRVLSRFGAYVRTSARSSIRKRKSAAPPGKPPSSHVGLLKRLIYFGYDRSKQSVVIGPAPLRGTAEAPPLLEYGGRARRRGRRGRTRMVTYRPRPFMGPAFQKEQPKLPAMWADSVR